MSGDNPYRLLPSVDELLRRAGAEGLAGASTAPGPELAQRVLDVARQRIRAGEWDSDAVRAWVEGGGPERDLEDARAREARRGVVRCVNATGVVLNTGLGRAPVHPEAARAMADAASSYCVLEVDRDSGRRNQRDERLGELLARLTGAEAGIAVNNCAAAVLLTLQSFAGGRACILSRGELVEIGGSFRMPAVMERAGVELVEVGTTNRTRLSDYEQAIDERTGLLLKVHTSNFRVRGFHEEVEPADIARLGTQHSLPTAYDLGSGLLNPDGARPLDFLGDEPDLEAAVASGVDVVMFSGDKLLGGPQAGLVVGTRERITELRKNPLYRALRLDKVALAGLEATLGMLLAGRGDELPARALLLRDPDELRGAAQRIASELADTPDLELEVVQERSQPGSGSAPDVFLDTSVVRLRHARHSAGRLAERLRRGEPPVFARVQDERVLLDPRTLLPGDEALLVRAVKAVDSPA